jgi:nidogen (entactin)
MQINENGLVSFMTEVPSFYNVEFPMDYPIIAPFYADIDLRKAGQVMNFTHTDY